MAVLNKMSWAEACEYLREFNRKHEITTKGGNKAECTMVAVMTEDSWDTEYSEKSRSYAFTNDNKAFLPNMSSNSIFSWCLDGTDKGVRLDWYIGRDWHVAYCYIEDETDEAE